MPGAQDRQREVNPNLHSEEFSMFVSVSSSAVYAVHIVQYLLEHKDGGPAATTEIARTFNIPYDSTMKVLRQLTKAGLVTAHRGFKGGFTLRDASTTVTLKEIIESIDGPIEVRDPLPESVGDQYLKTSLSQALSRVAQNVRESLSEIPVERLSSAPRRQTATAAVR